jgi:hypothetical protein
VHLSGSLGGDGTSPLDMAAGALTVGPAKATLTGTVVLRDDGASANLAWRAAAIPCAQLMPKTSQAAGDLAAQLGALGTVPPPGAKDLNVNTLGAEIAALAQAAGLARVSGTMTASGTLIVDTADLGSAAFTVTAKNTCGIALVGTR